MNKNVFTKSIKNIIELGNDYGKSISGNGLKYNVEYVSANPTGDLHLGHARGAALGDSLCRILSKAGYDVTREYYVNDAGNQIHNLVISAYARYLQALGQDAQMPEDGYHGPDIISLGEMMAEKYQNQFVDKLDENYDLIRQISLDYELNKIKKDLNMFGVEFDLFTSEEVTISARKKAIAKTGLIFEIPYGWGIQIKNKSGITMKGAPTISGINDFW